MGRDFAWEIVKLGINLVSLANNHALDYGTEGLKDCLRILRQSGISNAGGGLNLAQARAGSRMQVLKTRFALLSFYVPSRTTNPDEPCISTIETPRVLIKKEDGSVESTIAASEADVKAMEDAIVLAKRAADIVIVHFHIHDLSHSNAVTPLSSRSAVTPIHSLLAHKAVDAGADILINNGPHVLRAIEIYKGKPIFYSLSNFVYHWKTPEKIPPIVFERNDETYTGVVGSDPSLRGIDVREESETVVARLTIRENKVNKIELIPVTIDDRGPHMGDPRLANDKRGKEIIEVLQKLSLPYKTKISYKDWYGTVAY
jgi:poly-gamma-glutamate synthesis protein (capsule biosynthesis protein)